MAKTNKETLVEEEVISPQKEAFMDMMIKYQKQNPVKYAQKEAEFLKKLSNL